MALHYHTEYRLGNRGRIRRSYTGFQAFVAIGLDLVFGLLFEFLFLTVELLCRGVVLLAGFAVRVLRIRWRILVAAMTFAVYTATLPCVWLHRAVDGLRARDRDGRPDWPHPEAVVKPSWALSREV